MSQRDEEDYARRHVERERREEAARDAVKARRALEAQRQGEREIPRQPRPQQRPVQGPSRPIERPRLAPRPPDRPPVIEEPQRSSWTPPSIERERERDEDWPSPPVIRPMASPVMDLKRETANYYNYTPPARELLYDTPTHIFYRGRDNQPEGEPAGRFNYSPERQIMVQENEPGRPLERYTDTGSETLPSAGVNILGHEFGHKWYYEQMPEHIQRRWGRDWVNSPIWTPEGQEDMRALNITNPHDVMPSEAYANTASARYLTPMSQEMMDRYYAGLFNDGARAWQPPTWKPSDWNGMPLSDELRGRPPWSPEDGFYG